MVCIRRQFTCASGASYPMIARSICRRASPMTYVHNEVADNRNYANMLKEVMDYVNTAVSMLYLHLVE